MGRVPWNVAQAKYEDWERRQLAPAKTPMFKTIRDNMPATLGEWIDLIVTLFMAAFVGSFALMLMKLMWSVIL